MQSEGGSSRVDPRFNDWGFVTVIYFFLNFISLYHVELSLTGEAMKETKMGVLFFKMVILNWKDWEKDKDMRGS